MKLRLLSILFLCSLAGPAEASLILTLTPPVQLGVPGPDPLVFTGTLLDTDTDGSLLFLTDISVTWVSPADSFLSIDPDYFINTVPGDLVGTTSPAGFNTYTGGIFEVFVAPDTPPGAYFGTITVLGGPNMFDTNSLATQGFQVNVTPEPSMAWLTLLCLVGLLTLGSRRLART